MPYSLINLIGNSERSRNILMPICSKNHNVINLGKPLKLMEGKYLGNNKLIIIIKVIS